MQVNLVPMLDALVTIVTFLLISTAFISIVVIDTPAPLIAPADVQEEKLKEKPLQLTAHIQADKILISDWSGSREAHVIPSVPDTSTAAAAASGDKRYDLNKLHETLVGIKTRHPQETKLILKPDPGVSYESLIGIMDSARKIEKTDPPLYKKNAQGVDEMETKLFSEVIFGNLLS